MPGAAPRDHIPQFADQLADQLRSIRLPGCCRWHGVKDPKPGKPNYKRIVFPKDSSLLSAFLVLRCPNSSASHDMCCNHEHVLFAVSDVGTAKVKEQAISAVYRLMTSGCQKHRTEKTVAAPQQPDSISACDWSADPAGAIRDAALRARRRLTSPTAVEQSIENVSNKAHLLIRRVLSGQRYSPAMAYALAVGEDDLDSYFPEVSTAQLRKRIHKIQVSQAGAVRDLQSTKPKLHKRAVRRLLKFSRKVGPLVVNYTKARSSRDYEQRKPAFDALRRELKKWSIDKFTMRKVVRKPGRAMETAYSEVRQYIQKWNLDHRRPIENLEDLLVFTDALRGKSIAAERKRLRRFLWHSVLYPAARQCRRAGLA